MNYLWAARCTQILGPRVQSSSLKYILSLSSQRAILNTGQCYGLGLGLFSITAGSFVTPVGGRTKFGSGSLTLWLEMFDKLLINSRPDLVAFYVVTSIFILYNPHYLNCYKIKNKLITCNRTK